MATGGRTHRTDGAAARLRTAFLALAVALLACAPFFADGGRRGFVLLDDDVYIYENPWVLNGLSVDGIFWAFTTFREGNWHPLTWLTHMAVASLFGADPWWHHAVNVVLHGVASSLLFVSLRRLTGAAGRSALAAFLFAAHPLHVESVAWVAELKDVLSGCFFMLILLAYERHVRRPITARPPAAVTAILAAGLLAKPMLVTVPFVLLLLDWWPLGRLAGAGAVSWRRALLEKTPLFALVAASSAVTFAAQQAGGAVVGAKLLPVAARVVNAAVSVLDYLRTALWPWPLAPFYPYPASQPAWRVATAAAVLAAATAAALAARRRGSPPVGWFWFLGMLLPVIGLVQIGGQARADRYLYLPLAGLILIVVWGGAELVPRRRWTGCAALLALPIGALAIVSGLQVAFWRDSETLFRHTLAVTSENHMVHNNLGIVLARSGRREEAVAHFREAVRIQPQYLNALNNLGMALMETRRYAEARVPLYAALRINPRLTEARIALAQALLLLERPDEAASNFRIVLQEPPSPGEEYLHAEAGNQLGKLLAAAGRYADAERSLREALRFRPDHPEARLNLERLLAGTSGLARPQPAPSE